MMVTSCFKHINLGGTWWCCWKVDKISHASFYLGVGEHERLITMANAVVMPLYNARFLNLSVAACDPIGRAQPKPETRVLDDFLLHWVISKGESSD